MVVYVCGLSVLMGRCVRRFVMSDNDEDSVRGRDTVVA